MRDFLTAVGILLLALVLCTAGLCEQPPVDLLSDRPSEKQGTFGPAILLGADGINRIPTADDSTQSPPQPKPQTDSSSAAAGDAADENVSTETQLAVREVTGIRSAARRSGAGSKGAESKEESPESGLLSKEKDPQTRIGRPDKIALLAEMGKERKQAPEALGGTARTIVGALWKLGLVCGLAYLVLLALRWLYNKREVMPRSSRDFCIVDTVRLSPSSSLHVIDVRGKTLLVGCSSGQVNLLREFEPGEVSDAAERTSSRFAEYLEKYSAGSKSESPALRIAAMLRDCTAYLRKRYRGSAKAGGVGAGEKDEV